MAIQILHSAMFVGGGKAIFILYVRVFCPFTAIVRQPIYYQLKTFSFSADKMRSIRKLPELCLFLYFGTIHYTAVSASFDSPWSIWWYAWQPLIRDVRDVSDRQGPVVPWQGVQVGAGCPLQVLVYQLDITKTCRVNLSTWLEHNGWNSSFCSNTFDTQGDEVLEDIRNKVRSLFHCKSNTGCPKKFLLDRLAPGRTIIFIIKQGCTNCGSLAAR